MNKIVLINGQFNKNFYEPAGLLFITSYLRKQGREVKVIDPTVTGTLDVDEIVKKIRDIDAKIIGISILFSDIELSKKINQLCKKIKLINNEIFLFLGGIGVGCKPELYIKNDAINAICIGEGEETVYEMINSFEENKDISSIPGIITKDSQNLIKRNVIKNLDDLPFMARDTMNFRKSVYGDKFVSNSVFTIYTGRGCYGKCTFCSLYNIGKKMNGKIYRQRSLESVFEEIKELNTKFNAHRFSFWDECFLLPGKEGIKKAKEFLRIARELNFEITFSFQTRPETITKEIIETLKKAGLRDLFVGIENIDNNELILFNKKILNIEKSIKVLKECGFSFEPKSKYRLRIGTIIFTPYTTIESLLNNMAFFKKHKEIPIKKLLTKVMILPGTEIEKIVEKDNLKKGETDFYFKNKIINCIYNLFEKIINSKEILITRIRNIEKANEIMDLGLELKELINIRIKLNALIREKIFKIFEKLKNAENEFFKDILELEKTIIKEINIYANKNCISQKIVYFEKMIKKDYPNVNIVELGKINVIKETN